MNFKNILALWIVLMLTLTMGVDAGLANIGSNLIIHDIDSSVNEDGDSYSVDVLISAVDGSKIPITGVTRRDIVLMEDSHEVEVDHVEPIKDQPINVILMMDISVSMRGSRLSLAQNAVIDFIKNLYRGDSIAVFTFNTAINEVVPLTSDLNQAQETFQSSEILAGFGTCLFDAVHYGVRAANTLPAGRNAVVVLSGGPDTITGSDRCSENSVDEVLRLAGSSGRHTPIYTIGIGDDLNEASLIRLAEETGGVYVNSANNQDLLALFQEVANRMASEYLISYTSTAGPGTHTLTVQLDNYTRSAEFVLPGLPPVVSIAFPGEEELIEPGINKFVLSVVERGISIDSLVFRINDIPIGAGGKIAQPPYEYEIDLSQYDGKEITLSIVALDQTGASIAQVDREISFLPEGAVSEGESSVTAGKTGGRTEPSDQTCPEGMVCLGNLQLSVMQLGLVGGILIALIVIVLIVVVISKKKKGQSKKKGRDEKVSLFDEATLDGFALPTSNYGRLTILSSDDPMIVGKEFQLTKSPTTIGRSVNNDIALPKDSAVSRNHLQIVNKDNAVIAQEMKKTLNDGTKQAPTYGTFINDRKISDDTPLHTGDEISMGRRTKLRFEGINQPAAEGTSEDVTFDGIQLPDDIVDDATMDG